MSYVKGTIRQVFFEGSGGYKIGIIRIKETDLDELKSKVNQTITFTGLFAELRYDSTYIFEGDYIYKDKYGYEFKVSSYEKQEVAGRDAVIDFLTSSLIKGCGEKTAIKIVDALGDDALSKIKENPNSLISIKGITKALALKIYESVMSYDNTDDLIIELKNLGFTIKESLLIIEQYGHDALERIKDNVYNLKTIIDFEKLDHVFLDHFGGVNSEIRVNACILKSFELLSFQDGSVFFSAEELYSYNLKKYLKDISYEDFLDFLTNLVDKTFIVFEDDLYCLEEYYNDESDISDDIYSILNCANKKVLGVKEEILAMEDEYDVSYNEEQHLAIESALKNRISIVTGGPGTGKTTIINAIVKIYTRINDLGPGDIGNEIALLAPTGRASRKLSDVTGLGAMTIHRYLKWNKDKNEFQVNETNKNQHKLIIVDEVSMIDMFLFKALLSGINSRITLILVGDVNQLPSVGAGNVLDDLISSDMIPFISLKHIYRQTDNSYIPVLANEVRNKNLSDFTIMHDDYNFLNVGSFNVVDVIAQIVKKSLDKGITERDFQILAPIYRGVNGIDNLNVVVRDIYNPKSSKKNEISHYGVIFREGDKIIQLVNDPDINVFNGDIGFIKSIKNNDKVPKIIIDFEGSLVEASRDELANIKHAYAITIHKAQGSEFLNVLMPVISSYGIMLYNKLLYTGVSRAKKSLVIIGEESAFIKGVNNSYSQNRKTSLTNKLLNKL